MQTSLKKSRLPIVEKVERNDELLTEILVRLPPKFIFKFRCVSKRWNSIILHPYFHQSYRAITRNRQVCGAVGRLLAIVQGRSMYAHHHLPPINTLTIIQGDAYKFKEFPPIVGDILHSSGGLILCYVYPRYSVVNPLTKTWVQLPHPNASRLENMGMVCEENTHELKPSFRVVGIAVHYEYHRAGANTMMIETYSSKTGEWTTSMLVAAEELHVQIGHDPFVYNGVFYWYIGEHRIVVYDSNTANNFVQPIKFPPSRPQYLRLTRSSADDFLWVGMVELDIYGRTRRQTIKFWKIPIGGHDTITEDQWILMHTQSTMITSAKKWHYF